MATAEISFRLEYPEAFDFEDLRTIVYQVLSEAKAQGSLDLPGSENQDTEGIKIACTGLGAIWPDWRV